VKEKRPYTTPIIKKYPPVKNQIQFYQAPTGTPNSVQCADAECLGGASLEQDMPAWLVP